MGLRGASFGSHDLNIGGATCKISKEPGFQAARAGTKRERPGRFNAIRFSEFLGVNPRYAPDSLLLQKSLVLHGTKAANAHFTQSE